MFNHTRKMKIVVLALLITALCIPAVFAGSSDGVLAASAKAQDIEIALTNDSSLALATLNTDEISFDFDEVSVVLEGVSDSDASINLLVAEAAQDVEVALLDAVSTVVKS